MVEDNIYPISSGNAIITRPHENHHCIYHSNARHKHFWILFDCSGNEPFLDIFFNRKKGEKNLIVLSPENTKALISLCTSIINDYEAPAKQYLNFFTLIDLLNSGQPTKSSNHHIPYEISYAISYINKNISEQISIKSLAEFNHMSISTFERSFKKHIGMTPNQYIKQKRLSLASALLLQGSSVSNTCDLCGFSDCSHFIAMFKKQFGMTPLEYKKIK